MFTGDFDLKFLSLVKSLKRFFSILNESPDKAENCKKLHILFKRTYIISKEHGAQNGHNDCLCWYGVKVIREVQFPYSNSLRRI